MKMNTINVIDIEATCWEGKDDIPFGSKSEIIEIGICQINLQTLDRTKKRSILIKPKFSTVSPFCEQLTTITQKMLDQDGVSQQEAVDILLKEYNSLYLPWASYGFYDQKMFKEMWDLYGIQYPLHNRHTNIKFNFAMMFGLTKEVGMDSALEMLKIPLDGTHHRGSDDAWNIAAIMIDMIKKFPKHRP